jgi:hypothetical protein
MRNFQFARWAIRRGHRMISNIARKAADCQADNEMGSLDLIDCQEGSRKFPNFQVGRGKELSLSESLGSLEVISCQQGVLIEMGLFYLIVCQEGREEIPCCQVGKGEQMRLYESLMNSEVSSYQQGQLTEKEDQKRILMIGGIETFIPLSSFEASVCVVDVATTKRQPMMTTKEIEQTLMFAQGEGDEHSEEWLKIFSQEAGKEITAAWELATEEEEEEVDNMDFADLCEELEALEKRVKVQGMHIQHIRLETGGEY